MNAIRLKQVYLTRIEHKIDRQKSSQIWIESVQMRKMEY